MLDWQFLGRFQDSAPEFLGHPISGRLDHLVWSKEVG